MKAVISNLASVLTGRSQFDDRSPEARALSVPASEEIHRNRFNSEFLSATRTPFLTLFDRSAFDHISSGHEVSVVFTPTGPLVYRVPGRQN
jgi:hypothetical protein